MGLFFKKSKKKKEDTIEYDKPSVFYNIKSCVKKFFSYIGTKIKNFFKHIINFIGKFNNNFKALAKFLILVICYGFIINYACAVIFGVELSLVTFPAWGIAYYVIKEELPELIKEIRN